MNIGYSRVSTNDQQNSAEAQEKRIRAYAAMKGIELDEVVVDLGEFSGDLDRPGITRVLELVNAGKATSVIVTKVDRISRSLSDLCNLVELFKKKHVDFVSVEENIDPYTPMGEFFINMMGSVAQLERKLIGARTAAGLKNIKEQGYAVGSAPYGWSLVKRTEEEKKAKLHTKLVPNQCEQEVIAIVTEMRDRCVTLGRIAERLNAEGYRTRGTTKRPDGGEFSDPDIHKILKRVKKQRGLAA